MYLPWSLHSKGHEEPGNGLDVHCNDPNPIFPSTCSLEQLSLFLRKAAYLHKLPSSECQDNENGSQLLLELVLRWGLSHSGAQMGSGQVFPYKQEKPCGSCIIWNIFVQNEDWLDAWSSPETMLIVLAACTPQEPIHKNKKSSFLNLGGVFLLYVLGKSSWLGNYQSFSFITLSEIPQALNSFNNLS